MFGDTVYLQSLPKFGELELFMARAGDDYFVKARRSDRLGDRIFVVETSRTGAGRVRYSTRLHDEFTIVEDGTTRLVGGTQTEVAKVFFAGARDPTEAVLRPPGDSGIEFRKLESLFMQQQGLDRESGGRIALAKKLRETRARLCETVGRELEVVFATENDALRHRGLRSLEAVADLAADDPAYLDGIAELDTIRLAETKSSPTFSMARFGPSLSIFNSRALYRSYEVTRTWLLDNL